MNTDILRWFELMSLITSTRPQGSLDAVVVHARSHGRDGEGLLELVTQVASNYRCRIAVNGSNGDAHNPKFPGQKAWEGADKYLENLTALGGDDLRIFFSRPATNTRDEAMVFGEMVQNHGWKRVGVANLGHCLPRAMLGWVNEIEQRKLSDVKLFPFAPTSINWKIAVNGQQGSEPAPRIGQCEEELKRILSYPTSPYASRFVSVERLIEYLVNLNTD